MHLDDGLRIHSDGISRTPLVVVLWLSPLHDRPFGATLALRVLSSYNDDMTARLLMT